MLCGFTSQCTKPVLWTCARARNMSSKPALQAPMSRVTSLSIRPERDGPPASMTKAISCLWASSWLTISSNFTMLEGPWTRLRQCNSQRNRRSLKLRNVFTATRPKPETSSYTSTWPKVPPEISNPLGRWYQVVGSGCLKRRKALIIT